MNRRQSLQLLAAGAVGLASAPRLVSSVAAQTAPAAPAGPFALPPLGYAYEALEPHIDTATMTIHHQRHHGAFVTGLNGLVARWDRLKPGNIDAILRDLAATPEAIRAPVRNMLGGHWNHTFFWDLMTPGGAKAPSGALKAAIDAAFGDVGKMQDAFTAAGMGRFGSGWAWLIVDKDRKLAIVNTPYQDTPLELGARGAVIGVDVWEHAYYLKYQNRRADYLATFRNVVNWDKAAANYAKAMA